MVTTPKNTIIADSLSARIREVQKLVAPLRPAQRGHKVPAPVRQVLRQDRNSELVLAVAEIRDGESYRDWFFRTDSDVIRGQYFEEWVSDDGTEWRLSQACLHLFRMYSRYDKPEEVLAIHCEPRELGDSLKQKLKRGPHVHLKPAKHPLDKAHFPLNYGHLDSVLKSRITLATAFEDAVAVALAEVVRADWRSAMLS
jgi:hypothetical protein